MEGRKLLANWIMAPDGTMIPSLNKHDYREHVTMNSWKMENDGIKKVNETRVSVVDGGTDYLRRGGQYTEMSVFSDDPFEVIRRFVVRGGRGEYGTAELTYVPLFRISDKWLANIIKYEAMHHPDSIFLSYYRKEQIYRKENNIKIS